MNKVDCTVTQDKNGTYVTICNHKYGHHSHK